jgi:hypothetical protein
MNALKTGPFTDFDSEMVKNFRAHFEKPSEV